MAIIIIVGIPIIFSNDCSYKVYFDWKSFTSHQYFLSSNIVVSISVLSHKNCPYKVKFGANCYLFIIQTRKVCIGIFFVTLKRSVSKICYPIFTIVVTIKLFKKLKQFQLCIEFNTYLLKRLCSSKSRIYFCVLEMKIQNRVGKSKSHFENWNIKNILWFFFSENNI